MIFTTARTTRARGVFGDRSQWSAYLAQEFPQFTIEVLRTEELDGETYYGEEGWEGENPHMSTAEPNARPHTNRTGANFVGWGIMQSATESPRFFVQRLPSAQVGGIASLENPFTVLSAEVDRHTANPLNLRFDRRGFFPSTSARPLNEQR